MMQERQSDHAGSEGAHGPAPGAYTDEVLASVLDHDAGRIAALRSNGSA